MSDTKAQPDRTALAGRVREIRADADAKGKLGTAAGADATALAKALDDVEKEIAAYVAERAKLAEDTDAGRAKLAAIADRIRQHSTAVAGKVDDIITVYGKVAEEARTAYQKTVQDAANREQEQRQAGTAVAEQEARLNALKQRRADLRTQLGQLAKAAKDADAREDAEAYAEGYAIAKISLDKASAPPPVQTFATELRTAWKELDDRKAKMRDATEAAAKAATTRDDLKALVTQLDMERAERILTQVREAQAMGGFAAKPANDAAAAATVPVAGC